MPFGGLRFGVLLKHFDLVWNEKSGGALWRGAEFSYFLVVIVNGIFFGI